MWNSTNDFFIGFFAPWLIYSVLLLLHLVLPARRITGYVTDAQTGLLLTYRLNGLTVFFFACLSFFALGYTGLVPYNWLYLHRWASLLGACALGLVASVWIVAAAPKVKASLLADFYLGRLQNPQFLNKRVDAKMFLYLAGATMLGLNILSFSAHHIITHPERFSYGLVLYCGLFFWFLIDYMCFERVHLYTYDIFAERVGYKLTWGCFTFYPYFYAMGIWATAHLPSPNVSGMYLGISAFIFGAGWILARGANMQKFFFKTQPEKVFLGIISQRIVTDGTHTLLCSGFWGVSRHVNYLGEVLMATGLTLSLGYPQVWWVWLYPLYYVVLLSTRERDDEKRCRRKYGALWNDYKKLVPYRIIPHIY